MNFAAPPGAASSSSGQPGSGASSGAGSDAESAHSEGEAERAAREAREAVERAAAERISRTTKGYLHRTRVMPRLRAGYDAFVYWTLPKIFDLYCALVADADHEGYAAE